MRTKLKLTAGLQSVSRPKFPSEAGYVAQMNAQVKALTIEVQSIFDQFEDVTPEVMLEALEPTFEKAKYYTPKDTMALVESAYLEDTSAKKAPRVEMGFAKGGNPRYAPYVHEILSYKHDAPTQAKFLERAVMEDLGDIYLRLGARYAEFAAFVGQPTIGY